MEQRKEKFQNIAEAIKSMDTGKKKIFAVIGIVILITIVFSACRSTSYNSNNYQDYNNDITTGSNTSETYSDNSSSALEYEIIDIAADCNFGSAYDPQYSEIAIKAPKFEGLDYESKLSSMVCDIDGYCEIRYQNKPEESGDFSAFYKGSEEDVKANNGELIGFRIYKEGKYQMVNEEAIDNDDLYALVNTEGKTVIYWTRNSNCDENYYDSNGNLIYQQLFLNGSDHVTCFDSNGYEISLKDFYNSIISDYGSEKVVSYYFNDKLSKMD